MTSPARLFACPDCGALQMTRQPATGWVARCHACAAVLLRSGDGIDFALACAAATLMLLVPANCLTLLSVELVGRTAHALLGSGAAVLWRQNRLLIACEIGACVLALPFLRFAMLTVVLVAVKTGHRPSWLGRLFRWTTMLDRWAMLDVFLVASVVAYSRIVALIVVRIGPGGWCLAAAAALSVIGPAMLDRQAVWRSIGVDGEPPAGPCLTCPACGLIASAERGGEACPRCAARLIARRPRSLGQTVALALAGFLLYLPSNVEPMTVSARYDGVTRHTILHGIDELIGAGLWPLAVVVFCASIAIPLLKLAGLTTLLVSIHRRSTRALVARTRLHRFIGSIGRWSNIDVFTISVFVPLLRFGGVMTVDAGDGANVFLAVVVLTMIASSSFDSRLLWDAAGSGDERRA